MRRKRDVRGYGRCILDFKMPMSNVTTRRTVQLELGRRTFKAEKDTLALADAGACQ